jgi:hypothetical protein
LLIAPPDGIGLILIYKPDIARRPGIAPQKDAALDSGTLFRIELFSVQTTNSPNLEIAR